jgi:predicted ferric reductase
MLSSLWRRKLRLGYEAWQALHAILATLAVLAALLHVQLVGYYVNTAWKQLLWALMTVGFVGLIGWVRVVRPLRRLRRPWEVERVSADRGRTTKVTLRPVRHDGLRFQPGQFGWIMLGRSPFALTQHPFSFSSSAHAHGRIEVCVKARGDFTRQIRALEPGTRAYVDGPHGVFTPDRRTGGQGFVFIAGGVGITPLISMLRTFADRWEQRPCLLLYASRFLDEATFLDELPELQHRLDLTVVLVVQHASRDWTGERGRIDLALLRRHLPRDYARRRFFICGPPPMIDAMEHVLAKLAVPAAHVHTERFVFV